MPHGLGKSHVAIRAFGPEDAVEYGVDNWSLGPLQTQSDVTKQPSLVLALHSVLNEMGVEDAFAPHVAPSSARVIGTSLLRPIRLGFNVLGFDRVLHRNKDIPADAVFLEPGEAFVMSGAGCSIITAIAGSHMIVAHASRDSLIDRGAVVGKPIRKNVSVVHTIVEALQKRGAKATDICMCMRFAIPAKSFGHPKNHPDPNYRAYNRGLKPFFEKQGWQEGITEEGGSVFIDLQRLFVEQACLEGVSQAYFTDPLSEFPTLAHTRDGKDPTRRNLIVVKRTI